LRFVQIPPGGALVWHRDGVMAAVSVIRDRAGDHHLQVNNHFRMGGTVSIRSDHREAHIPLLLHPAPKRALFLGLGTGATLSAAGDHRQLVTDGVELVPEVVESFALFERSTPRLGRDQNLRIHIADARRFVRATREQYDVIVADLYHPSVDGSGALYAREHFAAIRERLAEGGVFCQWLPLHQLDPPTLRVIVRTFSSVFPDAKAYLAQFSVETPLIALVGGAPPDYPADWLAGRVTDPALRARLAALDLKDETALFGLYLGGTHELRTFAGEGPLNTDDRPLVAFDAPGVAYAAKEAPAARLLSLLRALHPRPEEVLRGSAEDESLRRLADYWRARNRFLELGAQTLASRTPQNFIADIAPQLVEVVQMSADFDAAYFPVIAMARQLRLSDPSSARRLLEALDRANPSRPDARRLLAAMPPA
jgi:spermidine synthase